MGLSIIFTRSFNYQVTEKGRLMSVISSQAAMYGVSCRNLDVAYDNKPLFQNFSLEFEAGRCTCLLGPSGCGKSTLIHLIAGQKSIDYKGQISFRDTIDGRKAVAWMSQKDLLLPWMTVINNITLGAKLRREITRKVREQAEGLLIDAGMIEYKNHYPAVLSGGMRQRVALLRTLLEKRPVILLDEPFSALDALTRLKLQDLSARLTKGKTVLLVTHDPLEALRLGDRIVVLGGSPANVVADIIPGGIVPRENSSSVLGVEYPRLLQILMGEGGV